MAAITYLDWITGVNLAVERDQHAPAFMTLPIASAWPRLVGEEVLVNAETFSGPFAEADEEGYCCGPHKASCLNVKVDPVSRVSGKAPAIGTRGEPSGG